MGCILVLGFLSFAYTFHKVQVDTDTLVLQIYILKLLIMLIYALLVFSHFICALVIFINY